MALIVFPTRFAAGVVGGPWARLLPASSRSRRADENEVTMVRMKQTPFAVTAGHECSASADPDSPAPREEE
jgi:hypothetical protein